MIKEIPHGQFNIISEKFKEIKHGKTLFDYTLTDEDTKGFTDDIQNPTVCTFFSSMATFILGNSNHNIVQKMLEFLPDSTIVFVDQDIGWKERLEHRWGIVKAITRWDFDSKSTDFKRIISKEIKVPSGYQLQQFDETNIYLLDERSQGYLKYMFGGLEQFLINGAGFFVIEKDTDKIISRANSSNPIINNVLEIGIHTIDDPTYRRKGFGSIAVSALIKYCLENGITPNWDAAKEISKQMALKIGFTKYEEYIIYSCKKE